MWWRRWAHWPLFVVGVAFCTAATSLPDSRSSDRETLFAIGCVLIGAGLVRIVLGRHDDDNGRD